MTWQMVTDPESNIADAIALQNIASKGKNGGRTIPLNKDLKQALELRIIDVFLKPSVCKVERGQLRPPFCSGEWISVTDSPSISTITLAI